MEQTAFSNIRDLAQVPVEAADPAIRRYMSMCFHCGNCKWTCLDQAGCPGQVFICRNRI